eukprot:CAMPEP_0195148352 /NCGR_PEP_ID=MMETSP0448-20130528/175084_1 /TAXON_ID=66468 /ORGANISM="Heterocapsa triquestra, Strain CCMP 448" /LENGTH=95 /DNA_ID=CAMNT_0040186961 /DNA_START=204 /DNA_END=491 /DNA_ORIENTATION=-
MGHSQQLSSPTLERKEPGRQGCKLTEWLSHVSTMPAPPGQPAEASSPIPGKETVMATFTRTVMFASAQETLVLLDLVTLWVPPSSSLQDMFSTEG